MSTLTPDDIFREIDSEKTALAVVQKDVTEIKELLKALPKAAPSEAKPAIAEQAVKSEMDPTLNRIAVSFLGMTILAVVIAAFVLSLNGTTAQQLPDALLAVGAAAVAALAGLLSFPKK